MSSSIRETHEWAKEKMGHWKELTAGKDTIQNEANKKIVSHPTLQFENPSFQGDVTQRDGDLLFHFFPTAQAPNVQAARGKEVVWIFGSEFYLHLADAFIKVFKHEERLFWDFVQELNSWVVRAAGFGNALHSDMMSDAVLVELKRLYEG